MTTPNSPLKSPRPPSSPLRQHHSAMLGMSGSRSPSTPHHTHNFAHTGNHGHVDPNSLPPSETIRRFQRAVEALQNLPKTGPESREPTSDQKLLFYGLYKQATQGAVNIPKPSYWDVVSRAKWDAWASIGSIGKEEAMERYVEEVIKFVQPLSEYPQIAALLETLQKVPQEQFAPRQSNGSSDGEGEETQYEDAQSLALQGRLMEPPIPAIRPRLNNLEERARKLEITLGWVQQELERMREQSELRAGRWRSLVFAIAVLAIVRSFSRRPQLLQQWLPQWAQQWLAVVWLRFHG